MIPIASTAALALAGSHLTETRLKATLTADGHSPKVNTRWNYVLKLTRDGKPVAAKVTARIIDPIGDVHTVHRANTHERGHELVVQGRVQRLDRLASRLGRDAGQGPVHRARRAGREGDLLRRHATRLSERAVRRCIAINLAWAQRARLNGIALRSLLPELDASGPPGARRRGVGN